MRHLAAYMLAVMGGCASPSASELNKILSSVGIETDPELIEKVVLLLNGKSLEELIVEGRQLMASVPTGGAVVAAPAAANVDATKAEAVKETKEAPKVEEEEDEDGDMGFGLFD